MTRTLIMVADDARARFFQPQQVARRGSPDGVRLQEIAGLVNPAAHPAATRANGDAGGGQNRTADRNGQQREIERRFAREIARALTDLVRRYAADEIVLAVAPRLLGVLRERLTGALSGVRVTELAADLGWHAPERIGEVLVRRGAWAPAGA